MSILKIIINIKYFLSRFFYTSKDKSRFIIKNNKIFKNSYYDKTSFKIKFSKVKKNDRDLIYKYLNLTNTSSGCNNFLNWGGGVGILDLLVQKKNIKIKTTIIEKKNLIQKIKLNSKLLNKYKNRNILFSEDQLLLKSDKFNMIIFFGSLCYLPEIYNFFKFSKAKFIAISRLPMIINSNEDFIAHDNFGNHYEYFLSENKFKKFLLKDFKILHYGEHWGGLKKNKKKIEQFKIKSFDILLERLNRI
tara:strand:- start:46274 stop:47014 length:741 start_codon:yes stop_codon:yes gene_type:complete